MPGIIPYVRKVREICQERRSDNSRPHLQTAFQDVYRSYQQSEDLAVGAYMAFFQAAVGVLQTLVIALGAGLGIWGAINLLEGYGNDNPGAKSQGMKQLMAGGGVALIGTTLVPLLANLFG